MPSSTNMDEVRYRSLLGCIRETGLSETEPGRFPVRLTVDTQLGRVGHKGLEEGDGGSRKCGDEPYSFSWSQRRGGKEWLGCHSLGTIDSHFLLSPASCHHSCPVVPGCPTQQIHRHAEKYHPVEALTQSQPPTASQVAIPASDLQALLKLPLAGQQYFACLSAIVGPRRLARHHDSLAWLVGEG